MKAPMAVVPKKKSHATSDSVLDLQTRTFLASSFIMGSDEDRGIITIVYKCSECGEIDTERLFSDKSIPSALCCVKCRAGFGVSHEIWGRSGHPGMFPAVSD